MRLIGSSGNPVAHVGTFSVGHVLFQVFCCEERNSALSSESETWLAPAGQFRSAFTLIAPSSVDITWPPHAVFATDAVPIVGERIQAPPPGFGDNAHDA